MKPIEVSMTKDEGWARSPSLGGVTDELHELTQGEKTISCPPPLVQFHNRIIKKNEQMNNSEARLIPEILHVSMASRCVPRDLMEYLDRWAEKLPSYSIFFHDDKAVSKLINSEWHEFPTLIRVMNCVAYTGAMTIDIWRVLVLYKYGGVYTDIDNWAGDNFTEETIPANVTGFTFSDVAKRPSQWFMAFEPRHPLMYLAMKQIMHNILNLVDIYKPPVVFVTGPGPVWDAYKIFMDNESSQNRDIAAPGFHHGAFGNIMVKAHHKGIGTNDMLVNQGAHNFNDIVQDSQGKSMTRRQRIEKESGVLHFTTQRSNNRNKTMSCVEKLAEIDEQNGIVNEEMKLKDKNGIDAFGYTWKPFRK